MRELLAELTAVLDQGRECVYCALVETRGSTPQKAGAAMLVFPDGSQRGTLGGGCVEAEVKQRALLVLNQESPKPEVMTFCLDDIQGWDDGLICGGRMSVLADPVCAGTARPLPQPLPEAGRGVGPPPSLLGKGAGGLGQKAKDYYRRFRELVEEGRGCTEAVVLTPQPLPSPPLQGEGEEGRRAESPPSLLGKGAGGLGEVPAGSRFLFDADGRLAAQTPDGPVPEELKLVPVRQRPGPSVQKGIAYLPILPRITLIIVGGGHVGQAVARLAAEVDFDICVLDDRESYASRERFPNAQRLLVGDIGRNLQELARNDIDPSTYCLIVTRGHSHDEEALYHLAQTQAGYVGMIGSKRKIKLIYEDLVAKGTPVEALRRVHAPLGFAIGSQTVPEIAVSIVAELIACRNLGATIPAARIKVDI